MKIIKNTGYQTLILLEDNENTYILPGEETTITFDQAAPLVTVAGYNFAVVVIEHETCVRPDYCCSINLFCRQMLQGVMRTTENDIYVDCAEKCPELSRFVDHPEGLDFDDVLEFVNSDWACLESKEENSPEDHEFSDDELDPDEY